MIDMGLSMPIDSGICKLRNGGRAKKRSNLREFAGKY